MQRLLLFMITDAMDIEGRLQGLAGKCQLLIPSPAELPIVKRQS